MIVAGIASIPSRQDSLKQVLESIAPQVDIVYVALNGYDHFPICQFNNVWFMLYDNSRGDANKFIHASIPNVIYFSCDDDLLYPKGYVEKMVEAVQRTNGIVTLHGKRYDHERPIKSFKNSITSNIKCLKPSFEDMVVHVGGTGCMAFDTNRFKLTMDVFERPNMADLYVAREAFKQGVPITAIAHEPLVYLNPPRGTTIWETMRGDKIQTEILNSFLL